jgi:hypothetical protein
MRGLVLAAAVLAAGCSRSGEPEAPKTYPAAGAVRTANGIGLSGGTVEFESTLDPGARAVGEIGSDGKFVLKTPHKDRQLDGAAAGPYRVTVTPAAGPEFSGQPIILPDLVNVQAGKNDFNLQLPSGKR